MHTAIIYDPASGKIERAATFHDPRDSTLSLSQATAWCQFNAGGRTSLVWQGAASADQHRVVAGVVVPLSQGQLAEQEWTKVRYRRFQLLADSDWRVTRAAETGVPMSAAWLAYRQALRDVTNQADPFAIVWPALPA